MGGFLEQSNNILLVEDYNLQNIMFVHNFVFIFLTYVFIFVFWMIVRTALEFNYDSITESQKTLFFKIFSTFKTYFKNIFNTNRMLIQYHRASINLFLKNNKVFLKTFKGKTIIHNMKLEFIWTLIPILVILEMILPSLSLIADDEIDHKGSLYTVGVLGNQWYWNYELNLAEGVVKYVSNLVTDANVLNSNKSNVFKAIFYGELYRLLNVLESLPIVVGVKTSFYITSNDVNHSFAIPGLGVKVDAIPGRINLKTVIASRLGLYSGMCSELCGTDHGFMPISVKVLTFTEWWNDIKYLLDDVKSQQVFDLSNIWYVN